MSAACSEEQIRKYVIPAVNGEILIGLARNEPAGGNDMFEYQTKAVRNGDDWIINGGKVLVTQADEVDVFMVIALTRDQIDFTTMQGVDIFFVPTSDPGFSVGHIEHKVGLNGSRTGSVYFDNCRVSEADRIPNPWGILMNFGPELSGYAALALGGAETMIAKTADYLKNRIQMGRSLWDTHQAPATTWQSCRWKSTTSAMPSTDIWPTATAASTTAWKPALSRQPQVLLWKR